MMFFNVSAIGERLRKLRKSKKLTQTQLSEALSKQYHINIDDRSISRYENGQSLVSTEKLIYLAIFFDTSADYILYGKEVGDENSFTWYDEFKRLNRLIFPLTVSMKKNEEGKIIVELWDDAWKVYYERLQSFGATKNYMFEHENESPKFDVKDMDDLFADFQNNKEQLAPNIERLKKYLKSQNIINPDDFIKNRRKEMESKRKK